MHRKIYSLFLTAIFYLLSCTPSTPPSSFNWQLIAARNEEPSLDRPFVYRVQVPSHWKCEQSFTDASVTDTKKPICEFYIQEGEEIVRITIHSFPIYSSDQRIPPLAQVMRWRQQFEELNEWTTSLASESYAGFSGMRFEGEGLIRHQPTRVMGWSMSLASAYDKQLSLGKSPLDCYKRADYTIKASGPPALMHKHRAALLAFAHSFELIDELPTPL